MNFWIACGGFLVIGFGVSTILDRLRHKNWIWQVRNR